MNTERLIDMLAASAPPVSRHAVRWRMAGGLLLGGLVSLTVVIALLGLRPDLGQAVHGATFWMKWAYTGSLGLIAIAATMQLARPDARSLNRLWLAALPVIALAVIGAVELANTPTAQWRAMWLGGSWSVCSSTVLLLSLPIFAGLLWSFRRFAPTRLRAAGAAAGLCAGAWAATLYCLHCPEETAIFMLTWYTLGIALAALLGAILGPRLLRW